MMKENPFLQGKVTTEIFSHWIIFIHKQEQIFLKGEKRVSSGKIPLNSMELISEQNTVLYYVPINTFD